MRYSHIKIFFGHLERPFLFHLTSAEENLSFDDTIYATLVSINNEWFIKHFTFDDTPIDRKILV